MVDHCYAREGSENRGSGVCRAVIHHNHRQLELEAFLDDPPHLRPMVISGNNDGTPKRYIHTAYQLPPPPPPKPPPEEPPPPKPPPLPPPLLPLGAENMAELRFEVTELREWVKA